MTHDRRPEGWQRRTLLKGMGLGALTYTGLSCLAQAAPPAYAAAPPTRFVYAWTAFDLLDPHVKYDGNAYFFTLNMYDNLLRYQGNPPEIVPWLAERYEVAEDGRTWTFHLRLLALGKGPAGIFKRMGLTREMVRALDTHTLEIQLTQPSGYFEGARHP